MSWVLAPISFSLLKRHMKIALEFGWMEQMGQSKSSSRMSWSDNTHCVAELRAALKGVEGRPSSQIASFECGTVVKEKSEDGDA